jgi:hypothetical protein
MKVQVRDEAVLIAAVADELDAAMAFDEAAEPGNRLPTYQITRLSNPARQSLVSQRVRRIEPRCGGPARNTQPATRRRAAGRSTSASRRRASHSARAGFAAGVRRRSRRRCRSRGPVVSCAIAPRRTSHHTCCGRAPSAIRTPISCVHCDMEYEDSPVEREPDPVRLADVGDGRVEQPDVHNRQPQPQYAAHDGQEQSDALRASRPLRSTLVATVSAETAH